MTATPMLDHVRQYCERWGVSVVAAATIAQRPRARRWTHDGPGRFSLHWPTRTIIQTRDDVDDSDALYLLHECSHVLTAVDPEEVSETCFPILALDYHGARALRIPGWSDWMGGFTIDAPIDMPNLAGEEWHSSVVSPCERRALLRRSRDLAVGAGLLNRRGRSTFDAAAWRDHV